MSVSIIIPTKDRGDVFRKTFEAACMSIEGIQAEIIVINDSKTSSLNIIDSDIVKVINNPKSGVASARNLGAKNSKYDCLLFLDDDIIINKENLVTALNFISLNKNCVLNLNWTYPPELMERIKSSSFGRFLFVYGFTSLRGWHRDLYWDDENIFNSELAASYFLMIKKADFDKISGYNEAFPHAGAEDFDFAKRILKHNIQSVINPKSTVYHNEADRIDLEKWLDRKRRSAETRNVAVKLGYEEMNLVTTKSKKAIVLFMYNFRKIILGLLKLIPNNKYFDFIYFRLVNNLMAMYLYKGFFNSNK